MATFSKFWYLLLMELLAAIHQTKAMVVSLLGAGEAGYLFLAAVVTLVALGTLSERRRK